MRTPFTDEDAAAPDNRAAVLGSRFADLVVGPAPVPRPGPGELLLRHRAVAVNPLDAIVQASGDVVYRWLSHPAVLGEDVAGEVVAVGEGVTRFAPGDRVLAYATGLERGRDPRAEGGFQLYGVVRELLAAPLPDALSCERAAVLPLAVSTAASALFGAGQLALHHPCADAPPRGEVVVVWGAATSVGGNAVQLAVAAGYEVVATASPRTAELVRGLGAGAVLDRTAPTAVADVVRAVAGRPVAGVLAVGTGSGSPAVAIAVATGCRRVCLASPSVSLDTTGRRGGWRPARLRLLLRLGLGTGALLARARRHGVRAAFVWGAALADDAVGPALWGEHLPRALADGSHVPFPEPEVVGEGLDAIQPAVDRLRRGVSARKLVVRL